MFLLIKLKYINRTLLKVEFIVMDYYYYY